MTDITPVLQSIDRTFAHESASTRRKFVAGAAGAIGSLGLLGAALPESAMAANDVKTIVDIAATAEVLATIVNTLGSKLSGLDPVVRRNVSDAAFQELDHYQVLTSRAVGAKALTKKIWVPDAVFANQTNLLTTLVAGDGIFMNAYLIGVTTFAQAKAATYARYAAEFMGVEAVHRAVALQGLGKHGNDLAFAYVRPRFTNITTAVSELEHAGFGFGKKGKGPGKFYEFDQVKKQTPGKGVNQSVFPS